MLASAAVALSLASPFQLVAPAPSHPLLAVQGRTVFVRSPDGVQPKGAFGYSLDGGEPRQFLLATKPQNLDIIEATPKAMSLQAADLPTRRVFYGPLGGPLRRLKQDVVDIGLSGSTMLSLEGRRPGREWIVARDVNGGPARRIARPGFDLSYMHAAGPYVSVWDDGEIIVLNWRTRREVYRVAARGYTHAYALGADGRIVIITGPSANRVKTATPRAPKLRTIARVRVAPRDLVLRGTRIVIREQRTQQTGRLVLLRPDGTRRALTPTIPTGQSGLSFDGRTLAFVSGDCIYAGPVPATTPTDPLPACPT